jgi:HEAT repeat protein
MLARRDAHAERRSFAETVKRLDEIYECLHDPEDAERAVGAIAILEAEASEEWLPTLHEWLTRPDDFFLREAAAPAVIRLEGIECLPRLLHAMRLGRREGHDNDGLDHYITELIGSVPIEARARLLRLAESESDEDRSDAAWLMGFIHEHLRPDVLIRMSVDKSSHVRQSACGSLSSFKKRDDVLDALSQRLNDEDEQVKNSAVSALGYFGDHRALPLLLRLRKSASRSLRPTLQYAIEQLRT